MRHYRSGRTDESGQELRVRLNHELRDLTPTQRIDLAMILMSEAAATLSRQAAEAPVTGKSAHVIQDAEFVTAAQGAKRYPIGESRLRRLVAAGEIPSINLGSRTLIRAELIAKWLQDQETSDARQ